MDDEGFVVGVILASMFWVFMMWFVLRETDNSWRKQIIDHGAAEAYFDASHDPQWRWKPCGPTVEAR